MIKKKEVVKKTTGKSLEISLDEINKKFGDGSIMKLKDMIVQDVNVIPTGSISLDLALGGGGVPKGRVIEIYGEEASGKTTLALHIIAEVQKNKGIGAFVDAEHALDPEYAKKIGVDVRELLISQPSSGEQALQIVEQLVRTSKVDVIVVDSVAALTPQREIDGDIGDQHIALQARLMSQALRMLSGVIASSKTLVIFLNQTRMKVGTWGNPETTPGGLALKFYSSIRINLKRGGNIKKGEQIIGNRVNVRIVKNKVAPPFKTAELDIFYNEGISKEAELLNLGLATEVIKKVGNSFEYKDKKIGKGIGLFPAKVYLKENIEVAGQIASEILEKIRERE